MRDFQSYIKYLNNLSDDSLTSIPYLLDYIQTCIPKNNLQNDTILLLFIDKFYAVANNLTENIESRFPFLQDVSSDAPKSENYRKLKNNINDCGLDLFTSEGNYYVDVIYDYFYLNFKDRVSRSVAEYLKLRMDEMKDGFSEDAGMLISFDDLYKRVKFWEKFIADYPNSKVKDLAEYYYDIYLETLLTGMDNSRTFDIETNKLNNEIKNLYENVLQSDSTSKTSLVINDYYQFLKKHKFNYTDSISEFLKQRNLSTMIGVQPHTR